MNLALKVTWIVNFMFLYAHPGLAAGVRTCDGCRELNNMKAEFIEAQKKDDKAHYAAVRKVYFAIPKLKKRVDGTLHQEQLQLVLDFLLIEKDHLFRQVIIERNVTLFRDNHKALMAMVAKLPVAAKQGLQDDIEAVYRLMPQH